MCGISTVCELFGLTPRAVRFYEDRGLVQSRRDRFNCRSYDSRARARLEQIAAYRQAGLSIEDILEIFALEDAGGGAQRDCATRKLKAKLAELDGARRQAEQLIQRFSAERIVAVNSDLVGQHRMAVAR
jgi:DNA-binding transcriptional MerR regulator